ncbi:sensor histidine kinase [Bacteroides sp. 519]|uniref:sensor histidine kinase n=1 Tax=Bacteroides sp. 519 TaxID=2302937 RepID=UPI0013D4B2E6|nr:sensor histidine kinase [Bacteroides sp. 519]NDV60246.1 histidine kinase [Bacteroides sp. 519]
MLNNINRIWLIFLLLIYSLYTEASERSVYNVLFVQSYTEKDTGSEELSEGLKNGFNANSISANIEVKYLNSRLYNSDEEEELMRKFCKEATARGADLIVVSNDEALYSLLNCGDSLPFRVPVVFFGVAFPNQPLMSKYKNITGTTLPHPYDVVLETAKKVFPERYKVVMVSEDTVLGRKGTGMFQRYWPDFFNKNTNYELQTYNITHDPLTDILGDIQISQDAQKSIMVVPYWGLYMTSISKVSKAPTFTLCGTALLNGVFCAIGPDMYKDAVQAANIASRVLLGEKTYNIPVTESSFQLTFDYKQLKFFNVKKDQLPRGSVIINEPYIEKYAVIIILFYTLLLGLLVFIVVRLILKYRRESRKRIHAQTKLLVQNRLIAQRNEFDHIFHSIRDAVVTYGTDFRIHFVNKALLQMLNIQEDIDAVPSRPFEGQEAQTLIALYNNGTDILMPLLQKVSKEGVNLIIPENSFIKDVHSNNYFPVSGEIVPLYDKNKQTGLVFTFRNVSEVAMQKHFFSLAVEESSIYPLQYSTVTNTFIFPVGYMNHMGFEGTFLSKEKMNNNIHPADLPEVLNGFEDILGGKRCTNRLTFRQRNNTGNYEWWEFRLSVLSGLTIDSPYSILGVCQSVQRYKSTEEELIAARDRALESDKLKTAFLANMSHEIRTPLNAIVGFSDLLKNYKMFTDEEIREFVVIVNDNCELLLTLINDILDLSRVEAGSMDFQLSPYYLPLIMQEIYDSQKLSMPQGVELVLQIPENSERTILTDCVRLKQVINNLIGNAIKFTLQGSIEFGYTEEEEHYTTFFVKDTGAGISQEDQERIFERFYKVDSFTQGAGLGLSISQTIVNRLKGTINVTSHIGKGTCFTVRIPNS